MLGVFLFLFIYAASGCQKYSSAMGTGPSQRAVSNLDLKPYHSSVSLQDRPVV